jgi:hypothetical protein
VDEQRHGPYRAWIHEHTFEERDGVAVSNESEIKLSAVKPSQVLVFDPG